MDYSNITRLVEIVLAGQVRSETVCRIEAYSVLWGIVDVNFWYEKDPDMRFFSVHPAYEL